MATRPIRLLILATHPVQYASPQFRAYAEDPRIDVSVAYCSLEGAQASHDPDFDATFAWDVPLLNGYRWTLVPNRSPRPNLRGFLGLLNIGLWRMFRRGQFDVVISLLGYRSASSWLAIVGAKVYRVPIVLTLDAHSAAPADRRGWKVPLKRALLPLIFRLPQGVFAPSSRTAAYVRSMGVSTPVFLTPSVVDDGFFRAGAAASDRAMTRESWDVPDDAFVALFVGKLVPWKRPRDVLQAVARAPDAYAVIAGDGELRASIESDAVSLGITHRVKFLGFVPQTELPAVYAASDVLILPSEYEAFGLVVNEMFATGNPAVVSDACGSVGDLVRDGVTGFVVEVGDIAGYARAIRLLSGDRELTSRLGKNASDRLRDWGLAQNRDAVVAASRELARR
jgi:glycosyltransferase involved in cell wall biosynthesis